MPRLNDSEIRAVLDAVDQVLRTKQPEQRVRVKLWFDPPPQSRRRQRVFLVSVPVDRAADAVNYAFRNYPLIQEIILQGFELRLSGIVADDACVEV